MLNLLYVKKLNAIVEKAHKLSTRLGNSVRVFAEAGTDTLGGLDDDVVTKMTRSKMQLESLREAAFLANKSLTEDADDGVENFVVEICRSWQTLSVESAGLLRYVEALLLDRESDNAMRAHFTKLTDSLIEGGINDDRITAPTPLGIKCQLRSMALVRRLRQWEKLPEDIERKLIHDSVDDVAVLLDLYIEYFSQLWTAAANDLRICEDLEHCMMTGPWTQENCVRQLEACQVAIRELNLFAINTKCKAAHEEQCSNGGLIAFCERASAVTNACIKLNAFVVPAVAIRSGTVLDRVYTSLHEFIQTKYMNCIWSKKLNEAYEEWILWFLHDSGWLVNDWKNDKSLFPFRAVWREGIAHNEVILRAEECLGKKAVERNSGVAELVKKFDSLSAQKQQPRRQSLPAMSHASSSTLDETQKDGGTGAKRGGFDMGEPKLSGAGSSSGSKPWNGEDEKCGSSPIVHVPNTTIRGRAAEKGHARRNYEQNENDRFHAGRRECYAAAKFGENERMIIQEKVQIEAFIS